MHAKRGDRANIAIAGNSSGEYPNRNQFVCLASPKYETLIILSKFKEFSAAIRRASNA
jgi:hypothetical protein